MLAGAAGSFEGSTERSFTPKLTPMVLSRIQFLTGCGTEEISSLLAVGPRPPSVPCFVGLCIGSWLPAVRTSEGSREGKHDRTRGFLEAAFHRHKSEYGRARDSRVRAFANVTGGKKKRREPPHLPA